ncbi:MAG TPA: hypothetical protein VKB88_13955 [Bryobacteraceae bacterium]|nr:hypothetical protein [Bryobacteraceae bacterium]
MILLAASFLCFNGLRAFASTQILGASGLSITVDPAGSYAVQTQSPAWQFSGNIGHKLSNLSSVNGTDAVGPYSEVAFDFQTDAPRHAAIRTWWNQTAVLFSLTAPSGAPNTYSFPNFMQTPAVGLNHLAFSGDFGGPLFSSLPSDSPWVFFDNSGNTFVFSAAQNFMVAGSYFNSTTGQIAGNISGQITTLPAGFAHQTLLVIDGGINSALGTWGQTLTTIQGKVRPANDADPILNKLGYWTDNGASYYYATEGALSYMNTLEQVKAGFDNLGISLGYMQLDSWFYPKGPNADWTDSKDGIFQYDAAPPLFGSNLSNFAQSIGIPLVTHARWIDPSSPYRQQYAMSGNVVIDPQYWGMVAGYLRNSGVILYEQDWLDAQAQTAFNLTDGDAFLGNMSAAMAQQGIDMQYCMPTAHHFLQSSKYSNLTNMRVSDDRFVQARWNNFLYASRLASALGVWPFSDVFMSSETQNLLLATLSAGPVGIGDRIGKVSAGNLLKAVRPDGVIVKPDVPIVPLDSSFQVSARGTDAPMIASTYSAFSGARTWYLFAYPQGQNTQAVFSPSDFGATGDVYLYDYFSGSGSVYHPNDTVSLPIQNGSLYLVASTVGTSGMAVIGDTGQFVTLGKKRIPRLEDTGVIRMTVDFVKGESARTILVYSPTAPQSHMDYGAVASESYDQASGRYAVTLTPGPDGMAKLNLARGPMPSLPRRPSKPVSQRTNSK